MTLFGGYLVSDAVKCFVNQVARCTKIINPNSEDAKYVINVKQIAKVSYHLCSMMQYDALLIQSRHWFKGWLGRKGEKRDLFFVVLLHDFHL